MRSRVAVGTDLESGWTAALCQLARIAGPTVYSFGTNGPPHTNKTYAFSGGDEPHARGRPASTVW